MKTILLHLPAYRDPELIPTIQDALKKAKHPERVHFGICRQYHPDDDFDNLDEYRNDSRFHIMDVLYTEAQGLPWARAQINEKLLGDQDYILQLDSHHRFAKDWDETLISMHLGLEEQGYKPILGAYLPLYDPFNEPDGRSMEPWQQQFAAFYPHGTIFIRPGLLHGWTEMKQPPMSRFLSGHFCFARSEWAKTIRHDPDIYFSGEEINLTVRSYTHGYDLFHPHKLVVWHSTMREERAGMLKWDDDGKLGVDWSKKQDYARKKIRVLLGVEQDDNIDLTGYDLGKERTLRDYERYAGIHFKKKSVQKYTMDNGYPPNPVIENEEEWENSFMHSFYSIVNINRQDFPDRYKSILVAFDDDNGVAVHQKHILGSQLQNFMNTGHTIHYEEFFYTHKLPKRLVIWAINENGEWGHRKEHIYEN